MNLLVGTYRKEVSARQQATRSQKRHAGTVAIIYPYGKCWRARLLTSNEPIPAEITKDWKIEATA